MATFDPKPGPPRHDIHLQGHPGSNDFVMTIDGESPLMAISGAGVYFAAREMPMVTLDLPLNEATIDGQAHVLLTDSSYKLLVRHGWTPPDDDPRKESEHDPPTALDLLDGDGTAGSAR